MLTGPVRSAQRRSIYAQLGGEQNCHEVEVMLNSLVCLASARRRRPSSALAASPRCGPRYSRGSEPPRRPQSARNGAPLPYQDIVGPSLEHVRELEAQGHFTEAAKILKAKLGELNSRAVAAGGGAAAVSARR